MEAVVPASMRLGRMLFEHPQVAVRACQTFRCMNGMDLAFGQLGFAVATGAQGRGVGGFQAGAMRIVTIDAGDAVRADAPGEVCLLMALAA